MHTHIDTLSIQRDKGHVKALNEFHYLPYKSHEDPIYASCHETRKIGMTTLSSGVTSFTGCTTLLNLMVCLTLSRYQPIKSSFKRRKRFGGWMSPNGCIFCKRTTMSPEINIDSDMNYIPALKLLLDDELTAHCTIDKHHHTPIFGWFIARDINTKLSETHGLIHYSLSSNTPLLYFFPTLFGILLFFISAYTTTTMDLLPPEIIIHTLKYLSLADLVRAERTCKSMQAFCHWEIEHRITTGPLKNDWGVLVSSHHHIKESKSLNGLSTGSSRSSQCYCNSL